MDARSTVLTVMLCLLGFAPSFAQDVQMGTWRLNEAKSTISRGSTRNQTVVYEVAGEDVKVTIDGVDKDGRPTHSVWIGKFDGKDYPVKGDPSSDVRSYTRIDDHTMGFNVKKSGRATVSGRIVVAANGKSRTVTSSGTDTMGKKISSTTEYERQ